MWYSLFQKVRHTQHNLSKKSKEMSPETFKANLGERREFVQTENRSIEESP